MTVSIALNASAIFGLGTPRLSLQVMYGYPAPPVNLGEEPLSREESILQQWDRTPHDG